MMCLKTCVAYYKSKRFISLEWIPPLMRLKFHKYVACGNDFVIVDETENRLEEPQKRNLGKLLCDRHYSVGCDSVLLVNSRLNTMRIIEKDGSESDMCGNGIRFAAAYFMEMSGGNDADISTRDGRKRRVVKEKESYIVGMGINLFVNRYVACSIPKQKIARFEDLGISKREMKRLEKLALDTEKGYLANTGEPHLVFFSKDISALSLDAIGGIISSQREVFPDSVNVNLAQIKSSNEILLRTYERGIFGETLCCGTGSTAAALVGRKVLSLEDSINVESRGGILEILFGKGTISLKGPAKRLFRGTIEIDA